MRSFLLLLVLLSGTIRTNAQISISNADMPQAGDTVRISTTTDQWGIDVSQTGAAYNWDFSFLLPMAQTVDTFFAVNSTPVTYQFFFNNQFVYPDHKASYARRGQELDLFGFLTISNVYDFYKNDGGKLKNVGYGANINGIPASVRNTPIDTVYDFPLTAGSVYNSYSENAMNVPGTFYYGQKKTISNAHVDGWGTISTPFGTFDCIRVAMTVDIHDTLNIVIDTLNFGFGVDRPTEVQYHWLANGMKEPLLQISAGTNGTVTSIRYRDFYVGNVGYSELENDFSLRMYPNPAAEVLMVETFGEKGSIEVFDLNGKLLLTQNTGEGVERSVLNISTLPAGLYLVQLSQQHSRTTGKLVVQR